MVDVPAVFDASIREVNVRKFLLDLVIPKLEILRSERKALLKELAEVNDEISFLEPHSQLIEINQNAKANAINNT